MTRDPAISTLFAEEHISYSEISCYLRCPRHYVRTGVMRSQE